MKTKYDYLNRFAQMLTETQLNNIFQCKIILFGAGGVGGAVAHFLVRSGIQNLDVVDFDKIDVTNINRQLIANQNNVGKLKVDELKNQLLSINPNLNINVFAIKYSKENQNEINLSNYDIIIDCIDDVQAKKLLIINSQMANKYILCATGAGNRYKQNPHFEVTDIFKTSYDPLAKILRKFCTEQRIKKLDVCYTKQELNLKKITNFDNFSKKTCNTIGSVVYYPISMACTICAYIINKIIKD